MSVGTSKATDKSPLSREFSPIKQRSPLHRAIHLTENVESCAIVSSMFTDRKSKVGPIRYYCLDLIKPFSLEYAPIFP